ncbi:TonB-dependent receptor plug domain-containing protein [Helicobacter saguini]|uniref:TonB-dependent receptor n=1 Tax=Helicobacter saguini TaxID=1548018 RepID=A0A347VZN4_9HELI|nr:TonB-dependent receptor [Helicobacter saguini]MWV63087.1 TonB-dependent receptor plug domain-containing protein [Helicobacter saguini]MWV66243.1 TonB-dependent receptor plug domain-containing protein [Helicobacter saguini]MWV68595.1 TonB-dependent receptor plug domain-containing protein [Helicobacter saguini]MWV71853.1 TonB-dependent receptor plug domain-containing protein [Helicobacter saguini]TLD95871.1 TonB-dependent receptor [Helicobacter saguini]
MLDKKDSIESNNLSPTHHPIKKKDFIESNSLNAAYRPISDKILSLANNKTSQNIESNSQDSNLSPTHHPTSEKDSNTTDSKSTTKDFKNDTIESYKLNAVTTTANSTLKTYQSSSGVLNREMLESNPSGNGDITSILKILPNVQFDNAQLKSTTPGEIDPANISISGGLYYQNNFQLDGFNMNNDLDPANTRASGSGAWSLYDSVTGGKSQGYNVDTSLLDSIIVLDSNISAAYGGFSGGVIEANTKNAKKKFAANISYQITQGDARVGQTSLTNYHLYLPNNDEYLDFINSTDAGNQPRFIKHLFKSSFESKFSENAGIIASFTTTQSFIPLNAYSQGNQMDLTLDSKEKTQKRQSYNFFIKGHYDIGENLRVEGSYGYMPQNNDYFRINIKDSDISMLSGGHLAGIKVFYDNALGNLTTQTNFNLTQGSRYSADYLKNWILSTDKNWNPGRTGNGKQQQEGSYGNVETKQLSFNIKVMQNFKALEYRFLESKFLAGVEFGYVNAFYERISDAIFAAAVPGGSTNRTLMPLAQGQICSDTNWCSNGIVDVNVFTQNALKKEWANNNGQYFRHVNMLKAGKINVDNIQGALFLEDSIKFDLGLKGGAINSRFGLRLDYDTYMNKATFAPRFSINYEAPWNKMQNAKNFSSQLTFGYNRYYGRNLYTYALMAGREALQWDLIRNAETTSWQNAEIQTQTKITTDFKQLKVPYSDELMGGIMQRFYMFDISLKYIHRFGRDEVVGTCLERNANNTCLYRGYDNHGKSDSGVLTLSISNAREIDTFGIKHFYLLAYDYTNVKRNYTDYTESLAGSSVNDEYISYNGNLMRYSERPADNFMRPQTFRFSSIHRFKVWKINLTLSNFFRFRSSYEAMISDLYHKDSFVIDGALTEVTTYRLYNVPASFNWDMRFGFDIDIFKGNTLYVNLDIFNVTDRRNIALANLNVSYSSGALQAVPVYEVGRSYWLQVGYKF